MRRAVVPEINFMRHIEPDPFGGCWLWSGSLLFATGYGKFNLQGRTLPAHRAAWEIFRGPIPRGLFVLHRCDIYPCANPAHLFLGTPGANTADMMSKGRAQPCRGSGSGMAKLTEADIPAIRARLAASESCASIGRGYGVTHGTINAIRTGRSWVHITDFDGDQGGGTANNRPAEVAA